MPRRIKATSISISKAPSPSLQNVYIGRAPKLTSPPMLLLAFFAIVAVYVMAQYVDLGPLFDRSSATGYQTLSIANPLQLTFDDFPSAVTELSTEYPRGLIDWGQGIWSVNPAVGKFRSNSVSFNSANGVIGGSFGILGDARLLSLDAYNRGAASTKLLLVCEGNPTLLYTVAPDELLTIKTGWQVPCASVTLQGSTGNNLNFDNLVFG